MNEFSLIEKYCQGVGAQHPETICSVGDDAAVISVSAGKELVISVDTMVEGVHFFAGTAAEDIAHKLFAVNLSDMAAMGAQPKWATIALTIPKDLPESLPEDNEVWLKDFTERAHKLATHYAVQLIGGDMTSGKLALTMQIMGLVNKGQAIYRSGAKVGDDVYVSNTLGDAALYLQTRQVELQAALNNPTPRVELGRGLVGVANSCIDISDGLLGDLSHISKLSNVSLDLDVSKLPISSAFQAYVTRGGSIDLALTGGDDYELAFTAPVSMREEVIKRARAANEKVTVIGTVVKQEDKLLLLSKDGQPYDVKQQHGYSHF